jgi:hypothetical protein
MTNTHNVSAVIDRNRPVASPRKRRACVGLLLCLCATGCVKLAKDWGEISRLHAAIVKEFGEKEVGVNLNNDTVLTVSFVNSPLNDQGADERAKRAEQTAAFVKDHYSSIDKMNRIWVLFLRAKTRVVFLHYSETVSAFAFDRDGQLLGQPLTSPDDDDEDEDEDSSALDQGLRPSAIYSPDLAQTDVMITGLQLQGNQNQGLTMSVYYKVPGDATGLKLADAPQSVDFDLASYSEKSLFPGAPKIQFIADGKVVFTTTAQFSTSKNADGLFSEFLNLKVPYAAFRRLAAGKKVTLKLGDYAYNLTDEQAEALSGMTEYIRD